MSTQVSEHLPAAIRWTSRIAVFSLVVLLFAAILHRLGLPTPVAFNMVLMSCVGSLIALVLAVAGVTIIWRGGGAGASRVVVALFICLGMFGAFAAVVTLARAYPILNDVTTDLQSPPQFVELAKLRGATSNPVAYPKNFAAIQALSYPDLKSLEIDRPLDEAYEVVLEVLKRQRYVIVREDSAGLIEAVDRTMVLGFTDDVAVRVTGDTERAQIDIRSASRFGLSDFGHNAGRVRFLLKEIVGRLEETIPSADGERVGTAAKPAKPGAKPEKERGSKTGIPRKPLTREKSGAQREPAPKGSPLAKDGSRVPDKRPAQSAE